ncbi:MAG: ATP synthase subunit I [Gammaproteobacteria bacterium]
MANRIIGAQLLLSGGLPLALVLYSRGYALSALLGGLSCAIPNLFFARVLFRPRSAAVHKVAGAMILAETGKLMLTVVFFMAIFIVYKDVNVLILIAAFFAAYMSNWVVPAWIDYKQGQR